MLINTQNASYVIFTNLSMLRIFLSTYYSKINTRPLDSVAWSDNDLYYELLSDKKAALKRIFQLREEQIHLY